MADLVKFKLMQVFVSKYYHLIHLASSRILKRQALNQDLPLILYFVQSYSAQALTSSNTSTKSSLLESAEIFASKTALSSVFRTSNFLANSFTTLF